MRHCSFCMNFRLNLFMKFSITGPVFLHVSPYWTLVISLLFLFQAVNAKSRLHVLLNNLCLNNFICMFQIPYRYLCLYNTLSSIMIILYYFLFAFIFCTERDHSCPQKWYWRWFNNYDTGIILIEMNFGMGRKIFLKGLFAFKL